MLSRWAAVARGEIGWRAALDHVQPQEPATPESGAEPASAGAGDTARRRRRPPRWLVVWVCIPVVVWGAMFGTDLVQGSPHGKTQALNGALLVALATLAVAGYRRTPPRVHAPHKPVTPLLLLGLASGVAALVSITPVSTRDALAEGELGLSWFWVTFGFAALSWYLLSHLPSGTDDSFCSQCGARWAGFPKCKRCLKQVTLDNVVRTRRTCRHAGRF